MQNLLYLVGVVFTALGIVVPAGAHGLEEGEAFVHDDRSERVVQAVRIESAESVVLDGRLDEEFWEQIEPISDFLQQEPLEGAAPTERTEVRIVHDGTHLYIGAILYDSEPDRILAYQRRRNAMLWTDDRFLLILDTFGDGRRAYYFETNPAGMRRDGVIRTGQGQPLNTSWDAVWNVATHRGDYGWSVEMRIPLRVLNFDPELESWGINFQRTIRRKNEEVLWSGHRRTEGLMRPQHAGRLAGMEDLNPGVGLEIKPYAVGSASRSADLGTDREADAGADVTYSITPNLRASLSINTDFAEVEVDERRVNLSRFPISFPERRDFFLEGANVFTFAPASGVNPFFSRQIGMVDLTPVPIHVGGRLAGQVGDYDLGFYQVRTGQARIGPDTVVPGEDFTAARVVRNIFAESTIGVLYTRRATRELEDTPAINTGHTIGTDFDYETSRFLGRYNLQFQSFFIWHNAHTPDETSTFWNRTARGIRLAFPNEPWSGHVSYRELGEAFDPAMGFTSRRGFRRLQPSIGYDYFWDGSPVIRRVSPQLRFEYLMDMDFRPETVNTGLRFLDLQFESGDRLQSDVERSYERLDFNFDILRDGSIIIPEGEYSGWGWSASARSASHRMVSGDASISHSSFWTGVRTQYGAGLSVRTPWGARASIDWSHDDVRLAEGDFSTHLVILSGDLDLSTEMSLQTNLQYDNLSEVVGLYARLRWIIQPGSDLYLVYTHNWLNRDDRLYTLERGGATKLTYTYWF